MPSPPPAEYLLIEDLGKKVKFVHVVRQRRVKTSITLGRHAWCPALEKLAEVCWGVPEEEW